MVEDLEAGRARHEVDAVAADVGVRRAGPVVQPERGGRVGDGLLDDVAREEDALPGMIERQPVLEQAAAHLRAADLHPDLGEDPLGLVDDPGRQLRLEDVEGRPHQGTSVLASRRQSLQRTRRRASTGWSGMGFHCLRCRA